MSYPTQGYLYQVWNTGKWNYSAPSGYAGPVTFAYRVYDGQAYSAPASVTIDVTNQAPDDGPYQDYLSSVSAGNQAFSQAVTAAQSVRDAAVAPYFAQANADADLVYQTYLSQETAAFVVYSAARAELVSGYASVVQTANQAFLSAASQAINDQEASALAAQEAYSANLELANDAYANAIAAAVATYQAAVLPFQQARDQALSQYNADPNSSTLSALQLAEETLAAATSTAQENEAATTQQVSIALQQASSQAGLVRDQTLAVAQSDFIAALNAAKTTFEAIEAVAFVFFQTQDQAAFAVFQSAENSAWAQYVAAMGSINSALLPYLNNAQAIFDATAAAATAVWRISEAEAWTRYNNIRDPAVPASARMQTAPVASVAPLTEIALANRDPGVFLQFDSGESNLFRYGGNSSTIGLDPSGLSHLPSQARGAWVVGTPGDGVFEYDRSILNQRRGIAGMRIRFANNFIALGGFPAEYYWRGCASCRC